VATPPLVPRTFQLIKGVGPWREKDLWAKGLAGWAELKIAAAEGAVMSKRLDAELLAAIERAEQALSERRLVELAELIPSREHWRIAPHFVESCAFLDLEADGDGAPTIVGLMDQTGLASFRKDRGFRGLLERLAESPIWVTFNGGAYDLPALRRQFEAIPEPALHVDLRFVCRQARLKGGLKEIEQTLGLGRPGHLLGLKGLDAIRLWREWTFNRELAALRLLVEYNLYDAINLRSLLDDSAWRLSEAYRWGLDRWPRFERGDVLYDLSRLVLALPE
jgi:uncharacterized protein YprB with RNaseH-like and TPR domain